MAKYVIGEGSFQDNGDFTPEVADAATGGNVGSIGTNYSSYSRVGLQATIEIDIRNIDTTGLTAGNDLFIRNIPFTPLKTGSTRQGPARLAAVTTSGNITLRQDAGSYVVRIEETVSGFGSDSIIVSELSSGAADIFGVLHYTCNPADID